ncbi:winged helix-turn-helix domain-containing protein [Enterobacter hormaechei]|uniref:winged helix-turn-helix domain-containing protein n=1 Tax=Enterobacter hormaechei TaxID=158836 RepID=UPI00263A5C4B|nr:winged helix-turn-helix domain-containing protein [Enterobacter hormaechei]MDN4966806.1 winged helix-turn-helix domain-containing protein [Enterobacter hormaechei]MDO0901074.1 winged helix-turn-helix domain-containing protein [Enterobacter hormaechei]MDO6154847.1 winged helix-turn-helix domain-containing protein [Enterobacter hormaechei]
MLYIIEDLICFRTDDGALWTKNDEKDGLILSPIVARLLQLFLLEQGKLLTRQEIMHYVWEKHGLEASNNSLNQYVSQLRKLMANFQLPDDFIRTVPREGFVLNSTLNIKIENESELVTLLSMSAESPQPIKKSKRSIVTWLSVSLFIVLISTPFAIINFIDMTHKQRMSVSSEKIGVIGDCPVYSVLMGRNSRMNEVLSFAQNYIEENNISCNGNSIVYFFATGGILKNQGGRAFLSHCQIKDSEIVSCIDYTYHSWM